MLLKFAGPYGLEFDQYQTASSASAIDGGVVLVSASVDSFETSDIDWLRKPSQSNCDGLDGETGLLEFPSGAKLEVITLNPKKMR